MAGKKKKFIPKLVCPDAELDSSMQVLCRIIERDDEDINGNYVIYSGYPEGQEYEAFKDNQKYIDPALLEAREEEGRITNNMSLGKAADYMRVADAMVADRLIDQWKDGENFLDSVRKIIATINELSTIKMLNAIKYANGIKLD